jgi:redox-sensing transcriptional repressor
VNAKKGEISGKTVERLALYRRLLCGLEEKGLEHIYSHQLAEFIGNTPAQIRRDIMAIGHVANSKKGYSILELLESIDEILSINSEERIALIGIGNLGSHVL